MFFYKLGQGSGKLQLIRAWRFSEDISKTLCPKNIGTGPVIDHVAHAKDSKS